MKLVIQTQFKENYGAHDWDGKGECPQYWKFKGGETYVFANLIPNDVTRIQESGIPTLTRLIENRDESFEEYILDWSFEDNDAVVCDAWETPWQLEHIKGEWIASRTQRSGEYTCWKQDISAIHEMFIMSPGGVRSGYKKEIEIESGEIFSYSDYHKHQKPVVETEYDGMEVVEPISASIH